MFKVMGDSLTPVKHARVSHRGGKCIRLRKCPFAALEVFQPKAIHICGKMVKLTETLVGVSVECPNK